MNAAIVDRFGAMASTSHFIHPIPERGLKRRLRGIRAETLVLWGAQDVLVPLPYAAELAAVIPNARVEMIQRAAICRKSSRANLFRIIWRDFLRTCHAQNSVAPVAAIIS